MTTSSTSRHVIALAAEEAGDGRGWVHLLPAGRFSGLDGRGPYVVSDPATIVEASRRAAGQRQMVIDYNHSTDIGFKKGVVPGEPVPAAGWITGLQARKDGIWGLVEWTPRAAALLKNREYRYLSPVFRHDDKGRIGVLLRASLTNIPNLDQLTALASAEEDTMEPQTRTDIIGLLGLTEDADDTAIVARIRDLVEKPAVQSERPDPARWVPIGDFQRAIAEANKLRQGISQHAAEERVSEDIRKGVILPWMQDWAVSLCTSNLPAYDKFLTGVGPGFSHLTRQLVPGIPPSLHSEGARLSDEETAVARNLGLTDDEFIAARQRD
jgi:phage I-like protein